MGKKGPRSGELWEQIRAEWEHGAAKAALARKYELTVSAIDYHQKKDGWVRDVDVVDEIAGVDHSGDVVVAETPAAEAAKIAELEAKLAEAEAKAAAFDPTAPVEVPSTPEGWVEYLGEDKINELVEASLASENVTRYRKGLPPLDIHTNPELKKQKIKELLAKREAAKSKHMAPQYFVRTVKVVKKNGTLVQIPVEVQINNEAGQPGAALWKSRDKGDKLASPYLCQAYNCWLPAAVDANGKLAYAGYCSAEHMALDPYVGKKPIAGVTTSSMGVGGV